MTHRTTTALAAAALALATGCESVSSTDVLTSGIYADLSATSDGVQTHTLAVLRTGGATSNTFVNLEGDDILTVTAQGETQELLESYIGDIFAYAADFDLSAADTEFVFALERSIDDGAPDSRCTLPEPFDATSPVADSALSRGQADLTVSWTPAGQADEIRVIVEGDCLWRHVEDVDGDPGTIVIPADTLASIDENNPQACDATVTIQRLRMGALDPAYGEGGTIYGIQAREVPFRSDP